MPRKMRYNRRRRRRPLGRRRRLRNANRIIRMPNSNKMVMPQRLRTKFSCSLNGYIAIGATSFRMYNVRLNGCTSPYDVGATGGSTVWENPFLTLSTLKPTGFTQLCNASMYTLYRVYGSSFEIQLQPESVTDTCYVCVTPSTSVSVPATYAFAQTQPYTKTKTFSAGKSQGRDRLKSYISVRKLIGLSKRAVVDDVALVYSAIYNTNPSDELFWVVNYQQADNAVSSAVVPYTVNVVFYVELHGLARAQLSET